MLGRGRVEGPALVLGQEQLLPARQEAVLQWSIRHQQEEQHSFIYIQGVHGPGGTLL